MKLVQVHELDGRPVWINADAILRVLPIAEEGKIFTQIEFGGAFQRTTETVDEIVAKVQAT